MSSIALGWDVFQAVNGKPPVVLPDPGGRWFATGIPYLTSDQFLAGNNSSYASFTTDLMVRACKWLRGGRQYGTVLVSNTAVDISWYGQTTGSQVIVGTTVRNALSSAGFTVATYTGVNPAPAAIGSCDIVILGAEGQYGPYSPDFNTQKSQLKDWLTADQGAVLEIGYGYHACSPATLSPMNMTAQYAVWAGPHNPAFIYNFTGAESIFGDVSVMPQFGDSVGGLDADAFRAYIYWGGGLGVSPGIHTYPDGIHCLWDFDSAFAQGYRPPSPGPYHSPAFAAYTQHGDAGNGNKSFA
jgi:hypothetical protein